MWKRAILFIILLQLITPSVILAASSVDIGVSASGNIGLSAPANLTLTRIDANTVRADWTNTGNTTYTLIQLSSEDYIALPTLQQAAYSGNATSANLSWPVDNMEIYAIAWGTSSNATVFSPDHITAMTGGVNLILLGQYLLLIGLGAIAAWLTATLFTSKNAMMGFPAAIFWALCGGWSYFALSTAAWDFFAILGFACLLGMVVLTTLGAWGLREKRDTLGDESMEGEDETYIDEQHRKEVGESESENENGDDGDGYSPTRRQKALHDRAAARKRGGTKKKMNWGAFR